MGAALLRNEPSKKNGRFTFKDHRQDCCDWAQQERKSHAQVELVLLSSWKYLLSKHFQYDSARARARCTCTAWCREIPSMTSLDVYKSGACIDIRKPISLHQAVRHPKHTACYTESTHERHSFKWRYFILKVVPGSSSSIHTYTLRNRGVVSSITETLNSCWARQGVPNIAWESHHGSKAAFRVATYLSICRIRRPLAFTCKSESKTLTCTSSSLNLFQQNYWATTRCSCTTSSSVTQQNAKKWTFLIVVVFFSCIIQSYNW